MMIACVGRPSRSGLRPALRAPLTGASLDCLPVTRCALPESRQVTLLALAGKTAPTANPPGGVLSWVVRV
jgi:hypothetical protein